MNDLDYLNGKLESLEKRVAELERRNKVPVSPIPDIWPEYPRQKWVNTALSGPEDLGFMLPDTRTSNSSDHSMDICMLLCMM